MAPRLTIGPRQQTADVMSYLVYRTDPVTGRYGVDGRVTQWTRHIGERIYRFYVSQTRSRGVEIHGYPYGPGWPPEGGHKHHLRFPVPKES